MGSSPGAAGLPPHPSPLCAGGAEPISSCPPPPSLEGPPALGVLAPPGQGVAPCGPEPGHGESGGPASSARFQPTRSSSCGSCHGSGGLPVSSAKLELPRPSPWQAWPPARGARSFHEAPSSMLLMMNARTHRLGALTNLQPRPKEASTRRLRSLAVRRNEPQGQQR